MSKIGKKSIQIPDGVEVHLKGHIFEAKGPRGVEQVQLLSVVRLDIGEKDLSVKVQSESNSKNRAVWGTSRALIANAIKGVLEGFTRRLEINGVGYRAEVNGDKLVLNVGYSHPVILPIPKKLEVKVEKNTIIVNGNNKQEVGQFAAKAREVRKPEPYKGKGIKYDDEVIRRKAGKVVKAVGG